jgi:hypothetical protein
MRNTGSASIAAGALAFALCAAHNREPRTAGMFGLVAFGAAMVGTFDLGADMWFEGFAAPWLAEVVPQVPTAEKTTVWRVGYLSSFVLFSMGWVFLRPRLVKARVYPRLVSLAEVAGGFVGFKAAAPPYGAFLGLASLGLGIWMFRTRRAVEATSEPITIRESI